MEVKKMPHISVVSPVYGCKNCLFELYARLKETLEKINSDFEIILVNDASPDNAWDTIAELAKKDNRVKGINLSRNFGQHNATIAGLDHCQGEWVVVMDCDLQDQPEEILKLYDKALEGFDIVLAKRSNRQDSLAKKIVNIIFFKFYNYMTDSRIDNSVGSFRMINRKVADAFSQVGERLRFIGLTMSWLGFKVAYVEVTHAQRAEGKTAYSFKKQIQLAVNAILSFSDKPLRLSIKLGVLLSFFSGLFILYKVLVLFTNGTKILGWSSLIASIFFSTGLIICVLGIVGVYVGKIFEEVKKRPLYILNGKINF
jgi:dolichol-phosphate mannosyltransferase